jgi:3-(3-hydroxy-phenyl)propionate hydroxylase
VHGTSSPALLATYEEERREHARAMIDLSTTLGRILSPTRRSTARGRDLLFRAVTIAPAVQSWIFEMRFKPQPVHRSGFFVPERTARRRPPSVGRMFIQPDVEVEGRTAKLDDVLGLGFALIGFECDPAEALDDAAAQALDEMSAKVVRVIESRAGEVHHRRPARWPGTTVVEDVTNELRPWFHQRGVDVVLLRPDRYVAAVGTSAGIGPDLVWLRDLLTTDASR